MADRLATIDTDRKLGGCCAFLRGGSWVPISHSVAGDEAYLHAKFHIDQSNRLATVHQRYREDREDNGPIAYKRSPKTAFVLLTY